jgi:hypothetical protein
MTDLRTGRSPARFRLWAYWAYRITFYLWRYLAISPGVLNDAPPTPSQMHPPHA